MPKRGIKPLSTTVETNVATAKSSGSFTISDVGIDADNVVHCWQAPGPYTGKGTRADEAAMQPVNVVAVTVTGAGAATVYWETPMIIAREGEGRAINGTATSIPKDPQSLAHRTNKRIGKVRGNIKFSYVVFA